MSKGQLSLHPETREVVGRLGDVLEATIVAESQHREGRNLSLRSCMYGCTLIIALELAAIRKTLESIREGKAS